MPTELTHLLLGYIVLLNIRKGMDWQPNGMPRDMHTGVTLLTAGRSRDKSCLQVSANQHKTSHCTLHKARSCLRTQPSKVNLTTIMCSERQEA